MLGVRNPCQAKKNTCSGLFPERVPCAVRKESVIAIHESHFRSMLRQRLCMSSVRNHVYVGIIDSSRAGTGIVPPMAAVHPKTLTATFPNGTISDKRTDNYYWLQDAKRCARQNPHCNLTVPCVTHALNHCHHKYCKWPFDAQTRVQILVICNDRLIPYPYSILTFKVITLSCATSMKP